MRSSIEVEKGSLRTAYCVFIGADMPDHSAVRSRHSYRKHKRRSLSRVVPSAGGLDKISAAW